MTQPSEATPLRSADTGITNANTWAEGLRRNSYPVQIMGRPGEMDIKYFSPQHLIVEQIQKEAYAAGAAAGAERMRGEAVKLCDMRAQVWAGSKGPCAMSLEEECEDIAQAIRKLPTAVQQVEPAGEK